MPGLTFTYGYADSALSKLERALSFDDRYSTCHLFREKGACLSANTYAEYPIAKCEIDSCEIFFEGHIYNRNWKEVAADLASHLRHNLDQKALNCICECDGEFLFVCYFRALHKVFFLNDSWGRLPVYIYSDSGKKIITREILAAKILSHAKMDAIAVGQNLIFGYTLGKQTLYEKIERLPPNALMELHLVSEEIKLESQFSLPLKSDLVGIDNLESIVTHFEKGLINRLTHLRSPILSLSAGLDSRLIAGFLAKAKMKTQWRTFDYDGLSRHGDVQGAIEIAKRLGREESHKILKLAKPDLVDFETLISIKQGFNSLSMAFILQFYKATSSLGDTITGDGGDKFLADLRPLKRCRSEAQLLKYILRHHGLMDSNTAAAMCNVPPRELKQSILDVLRSYQVSSMTDRFICFTLCERGQHWLFEGEDRNRYFSWSTSPFYNPTFIQSCLQAGMACKANGKLFNRIFKMLPGELMDVENPNWQAAPSQKNTVRKLMAKQKLKHHLPAFLLPQKKRTFNEFMNSEELDDNWDDILKNRHLFQVDFLTLKLPQEAWWRFMTLNLAVSFYESASSASK